ncbi:MAG: hypothetical protein LCH62_10990 [Proteobacteria bacterium]|nr:hypothetical protein [Pseudomonadota bacterium]
MALSKMAAVIRHGYPGLPLAVGLAHHHDVVEFDISVERARELSSGADRAGEVGPKRLCAAKIGFAGPADANKNRIITVSTLIVGADCLDRDTALAAGRTPGRVLQGGSSGAFALDVNSVWRGRSCSRELRYATH